MTRRTPDLRRAITGFFRTFGAKKSGKRLKLCNLQSFPVCLTETGKATDDNYLQPPCTKSAEEPTHGSSYNVNQQALNYGQAFGWALS
jgi:hypothetical protein